jgi:hypothetical protein
MDSLLAHMLSISHLLYIVCCTHLYKLIVKILFNIYDKLQMKCSWEAAILFIAMPAMYSTVLGTW